MKNTSASSNGIMREWQERPGLVYFLRAGDFVKVGVTAVRNGETYQKAIARRHKGIQTANHEHVELLGAILFLEGNRPAMDAEQREREILNRFAALSRFKRHTIGAEWLSVSDDLLAFIRDNAKRPEELGVATDVGTLAADSLYLGSTFIETAVK